MEIIIRRRDIYVTLAAITLFVCWVAYAQFENRAIQTSLKQLAAGHVDEWFNTEEPGTRREDFEYVAIVDTERPYQIFGPSYGVVHVYIRDKGDVDCKTFKGIEYYYKHDGDTWVLGDSAGCSAREHHIRAFENYLAEGYGVEEHVIDDALGIDFDVEKLRARIEGGPGHVHHDHDEHHAHDHHHHEQTQPAHAASDDPAPEDDALADRVRNSRQLRGLRQFGNTVQPLAETHHETSEAHEHE